MIRVNLFGEVKDNTPVYVLQLAVLGLSTLLTIGGAFVIQNNLAAELSAKQDERAQLEQRLAKLKEKTQKVDELEKKKKLLGEKLTTIANLKVKKQGPVHVMDELTKSIPVRSWLTDITQKDDLMEFSGVAVDPQTVSEFMKKLGESLYFKGIELVYSRRGGRNDAKLQEFSVSARLTNAADIQKALEAKNVSADSSAVDQPVGEGEVQGGSKQPT